MLPLQLHERSGLPFYRQIVDQIADLIRSGQLPAGARLPSVRELCEQLAVSLITGRRAYSDLEAAGLIEVRQGEGSFVRERMDKADVAAAHQDAEAGLVAAVARARQLGLAEGRILEIVSVSLESHVGGSHER